MMIVISKLLRIEFFVVLLIQFKRKVDYRLMRIKAYIIRDIFMKFKILRKEVAWDIKIFIFF